MTTPTTPQAQVSKAIRHLKRALRQCRNDLALDDIREDIELALKEIERGATPPARDDDGWLTITCKRAFYVSEGRERILCDRLPSPVTMVLELAEQAPPARDDVAALVAETEARAFSEAAELATSAADKVTIKLGDKGYILGSVSSRNSARDSQHATALGIAGWLRDRAAQSLARVRDGGK